MERKRIYTFVLLSISLFHLLPSVAHAQRKQKVQPTKPDTVAFFRGVAVGVDVVGPAMKALSSYGQYEALLRVNLQDKYYPVLEIGVGEANKTDDNTSTQFKTRAPYGRVGIDFNVLKDKHDAYRVLAGGRVGYTTFKYDVSAPAVTDPIWGNQVPFGGTGVRSHLLWIEASFGVDAKIWGPIRMGWSLRYKVRAHQKSNDLGDPWYVPGYGRGGSSTLGATFNVLLEL